MYLNVLSFINDERITKRACEAGGQPRFAARHEALRAPGNATTNKPSPRSGRQNVIATNNACRPFHGLEILINPNPAFAFGFTLDFTLYVRFADSLIVISVLRENYDKESKDLLRQHG